MRATHPTRGFTLIELMVVTAIIGILATVAIPSFLLMTERAKAAERTGVVRSLRNTLNTMRMKDGAFGTGLNGPWNPAPPLATVKRTFSTTVADWNKLDLTIEGQLYYSYHFVAGEGVAPALPFFTIDVWGDVDGNGDEYTAQYLYELNSAAATFVQKNDGPSAIYEFTVF